MFLKVLQHVLAMIYVRRRLASSLPWVVSYYLSRDTATYCCRRVSYGKVVTYRLLGRQYSMAAGHGISTVLSDLLVFVVLDDVVFFYIYLFVVLYYAYYTKFCLVRLVFGAAT